MTFKIHHARRPALWLLCLALLLAGCGANKAEQDAAIRKAIEQHLAGRPGLSSDQIVMEMKQVQVQGDRAEADVLFHSRNDPNAQMSFHYQLRSEGNQWKVDAGRSGAAGSAHPPSAPPSEAAPALPEGHPSIE